MEIVGWAGFGLIQIFYIPQTFKILRSRDASGLSLPSWFILAVGLLCYLIYSIYRDDLIFTVGNAAGLVQSLLMIALILKFNEKKAIQPGGD